MEHDKKTAQDALKNRKGMFWFMGGRGQEKVNYSKKQLSPIRVTLTFQKCAVQHVIQTCISFAVLMKIFTWIIFWMRRNPLSFSIV